MHEYPHNPNGHPCDCGCPIHRGTPRLFFTDRGCYCSISCASQPLTFHCPQTGDAFFLDQQSRFWHVPGLEPGHWDWNAAIPCGTGTGYTLDDVAPDLFGLLLQARDTLDELDAD